MKLAYLVTAYKQPALFKRVFEAIYDPDNHYLVHVDKKSPDAVHRTIRDFLAQYPNARVMESSNWVYGGYSAVEIQLRAIRELLPLDWNFFLNLTGQDYPLKTQAQMKAFLAEHPGRNFLHVMDQRRDWPGSWFRMKWHWVELRGPVPLPPRKRMIPLPVVRRFLAGVTPYAGSTWFIISREFCEYLCTEQKIGRYEAFYRHTYIPEEHFFQTVIMHSPFRETVIKDNKRLIMWPDGRIHTFKSDDYNTLVASDAFFARKFDESVDREILDRLEQRLKPGVVAQR